MSDIRYALITGAGSGIGLATAELFIKNNWRVIAVGRTLSKLQALQKNSAENVFPIACDLSKVDDIKRLMSEISGLVPSIKVLVNNAGIWERRSFLESDDDLWRTQFETNLLGSVRITRELLKLSMAQKVPVSVVNVSSTLGLRPIAETSSYSASKAAMISWTKTLALELASHGVRVNCICPGIVDTPIHDFHGQLAPEFIKVRESIQKAQPLGRMGLPSDVAAGIYYLGSDQAQWITGTILNIDGGISL